eukprot:1948051-Prymnesium_polylepis.1
MPLCTPSSFPRVALSIAYWYCVSTNPLSCTTRTTLLTHTRVVAADPDVLDAQSSCLPASPPPPGQLLQPQQFAGCWSHGSPWYWQNSSQGCGPLQRWQSLHSP